MRSKAGSLRAGFDKPDAMMVVVEGWCVVVEEEEEEEDCQDGPWKVSNGGDCLGLRD